MEDVAVQDGQEADAEQMNCERQKIGFCSQISGSSCLSGVSTAYSMEDLSSPEFFSYQCAEIDVMASRAVDESTIAQALSSALSDVQLCVSVGDPRSPDCPLIAVSDCFEAMTGYSKSEILGKNCRFLQVDDEVDCEALMQIRHSCATGAPVRTVLVNRRKSGDLFLNLVDIRGLTVACNPSTGEELWFLVGIQADVTDLASSQSGDDLLAKMHTVADDIRTRLSEELSALAVAGALNTCNFAVATPEESPQKTWCLMPLPSWRPSDAPDVAGAADAAAGSADTEARGGGPWQPPPTADRLMAKPPTAELPTAEAGKDTETGSQSPSLTRTSGKAFDPRTPRLAVAAVAAAATAALLGTWAMKPGRRRCS